MMVAVLEALMLLLIVRLLVILQRLIFHPLRSVPGPWTYAASSTRLTWDDFRAQTTRSIHRLHEKYGSVVRIGPQHVSFASATALKTIYGVGSRSQRTSFYKLFEPFGKPTMFTMSSAEEHGQRKKLIAKVYAKSGIMREPVAKMIESKVYEFVQVIEHELKGCDIGRNLHYFTLDVSTAFIFGEELGTKALLGNEQHRALLIDFQNPFRRQLSWLAVHGGPLNYLSAMLLEIFSSPAPFTAVRDFALETSDRFCAQAAQAQSPPAEHSLISQLWSQRQRSDSTLEEVDIASECADHLLAALETTRNTLLFLIWALSLEKNRFHQEKLRQELRSVARDRYGEFGLLTTEAADKMPYLNAVLKEALRLYAPLPELQPRCFTTDTVIDGYIIPANTTVSTSPYSLHRNADIFDHPYSFQPDRWLHTTSEGNMNRWWWPFSSGARMCTGIHLAMADMTTLVAALYSRFESRVPTKFGSISPSITSRFEIFWDEQFHNYTEDECIIEFGKI